MRQRILKRIQELANKIDKVDWRDKRIYGAYVAQTYYYVRHSTRLLALSASKMPLDQDIAHQRFIKHITEENHHDRLAENDLKAMGFSIGDFPELEAVKAFYQNQYYYVEHVSPWSLLGYILALEGLAVERGEDLYDVVAGAHGAKAATFLKVHAAEDVDHLEKALQMIESLPPAELEGIVANLEMSCYLYEAMLEDLPKAARAHASPRKTLKAA